MQCIKKVGKKKDLMQEIVIISIKRLSVFFVMSDLVKLKSDYFDDVVKNIKDNICYTKEDVFCLVSEDLDIGIPDIDNFYIIHDKRKYITNLDNKVDEILETGTVIDFFVQHKNIHNIFTMQTISDLENGIYYKGFKVSEL